ncbi:copper amine oxidase [Chaetomium sp. MPI-SDFR-AT-0129]|nr:copper amine oxidase [Chaetomium sp. MPI-SDFR-AT-0129]
MTSQHPFDPLTGKEIQLAAEILRKHHAVPTEILFRAITLCEPRKADMVPFLDQEHAGEAPAPPARIARILAHVNGTFTEFKVNLDQDSQGVISEKPLPGRHSHIDGAYMRRAEQACLADVRVQEQVAALKLPEGATVVAEPWSYGTDGMNDMSQLVTMCWFYMRMSDDPDANYYAYPLDLCVEMSHDLRVVKILHLPSGNQHDRVTESTTTGGKNTTTPKEYDHRKLHTGSEYYPTLNTIPPPRTTTRPYHVAQPHGPSFAVDGHKITWEKWHFRVGFNYREGMTLHDVRFDGRSLFYRLSLAEMFVPYGDPRTPYPRKAAFDLGNDGAGLCANSLALGCDCLGCIKYFDGWLVGGPSGLPLKFPNVICCHEIDDGILWKHTNFRTGNAAVTRSRVLVLQTVITASNYEYIFCFYFGQDASLHYEVRATGILSTAPVDLDAHGRNISVPYGTTVAPGVLAPFHQHLFCLRIDPAVDGHANSLLVHESHALPADDPADPSLSHNPHGVGYATTQQYVEDETGLDLDFTTNRTFTIVNEARRHPFTGTPVGFRLMPWYSQTLLAQPGSWHAKRAEFARHAVWLTRYPHGSSSDNHDDERDELDEMFPAGRFTMQSAGGEGIASWIEGRKRKNQEEDKQESTEKEEEKKGNARDTDIVVWHTFGSTHNPRAEDWPVMPVEKMVVGLKPVNFFERNPALDVPVATQERNRSVLVDDADASGMREGDNGKGKECCV